VCLLHEGFGNVDAPERDHSFILRVESRVIRVDEVDEFLTIDKFQVMFGGRLRATFAQPFVVLTRRTMLTRATCPFP
jgi:hypothetical protein